MSSPERSPLILCAGIAVIDYIFRIEAMPKPDTKNRASAFTDRKRRQHGQCGGLDRQARRRARACSAPLGGPAGTDLPATRSCENSNRKISTIPPWCGSTAWPRRFRRSSCNPAASVRSSIIATMRWQKRVARTRSALVATADAVLIDNRFPEFSLPIAQAAKKRGKIVLMDADDPTRETDALLNACTHVVFSSHGLRNTAQMQDFTAGLNAVAKRTPALARGHRRREWLLVARRTDRSPHCGASASRRSTRSAPATSFTAPAC